MRWSIAMLVACGSSAAPPAPVAPVTQATPVASAVMSRLEVAGTNSWLEIAVAGTDEGALQACVRAIGYERHRLAPKLTVNVLRECAASALPVVRRGGFVIVTPGPLDLIDLEKGSITQIAWYASAADCERARSWLERAHADERVATEQAVTDFIAGQRAEAERREQVACDRLAAQQPCAKRQAECDLERRPVERNCELAREEVTRLRDKKPDGPTRVVSCRTNE